MHEYYAGNLHSGSKHGPVVQSRAQAIAIGLNEERHSPARKAIELRRAHQRKRQS